MSCPGNGYGLLVICIRRARVFTPTISRCTSGAVRFYPRLRCRRSLDLLARLSRVEPLELMLLCGRLPYWLTDALRPAVVVRLAGNAVKIMGLIQREAQ